MSAMSNEFEDTFVRILAANERRKRKEKTETRGCKPRKIYLGDTARGRALANQEFPAEARDPTGSGGMREIAGKGHAGRAHRKSGSGRNIRKVGVTWK